ncbi:MAG: hypoxanthine phosphoribosyltransferase [Clostridia bacterium]|nr:hypoxanthine phosphoribosyltransferase [Clostridia bacterium]
MQMLDRIEKIFYTAEDLDAAVKRLGAQISKDYEGKNLMLVSVLKGSIVFMADLMRAITVPCKIDFMSVSSYKSETSTGVVRILKDLDESIAGCDVLIVEDILDTGRTLSYLKKLLLNRNPASFRICTLIDKPEARVADDVTADYVGLNVPNEFIVGYGLDCDQLYRNLPFIGVLKQEYRPG